MDLQQVWEKLQLFFAERGAEFGLKIITAAVILIAGRWIAKVIKKLVSRLMTRAKVDPTIRSFVENATYILLMMFLTVDYLQAWLSQRW